MIRKAVPNDLVRVMEIINMAKAYLKDKGIPQWQNGYPNEESILNDIHKEVGYVLVEDNKVIGYSAIMFEVDPNYATIDGKWLNDEPYGVIHRTCVDNSYKGKGLALQFYEYAKEMAKTLNVKNLRIDTHELNLSMQKCVAKFGFEYCGVVTMLSDGSPRFAYQLEM